MVYDDAEKLYAEVREDTEYLLQKAGEVLFPDSIPYSVTSAPKSAGSLLGVNTTFFPRRDIVQVPLGSANAQLKSQMVQVSKDGATGYALLDGSASGQIAKPVGFFADCKPVSGA